MRYFICSVAVIAGAFGSLPAAHAQTESAPPQAAPPATPTAEQPVEATLATAPASEPTPPSCFPPCRSGYLCHAGECISACNPPCAPAEQCRDGECVATTQRAPPPRDEELLPARDPTAERHDGFMLRLTFGFGYSRTTGVAESDSDELVVRGFSAGLSIDLGGALSENLVLHARLADLVVLSPTYEVNGVEYGEQDDRTFAGLLLAPALTYYEMPANVYFTVAPGLSWLNSSNGSNNSTSTDFGFGVNADIGKEWWVSDQWGLGVALRFWFTYLEDSEGDLGASYSMLGFALLFSATLN